MKIETQMRATWPTMGAWLVLLTALFSPGAQGALDSPLDNNFSGTPPASPALPWVDARFVEEAGGTVLFTLQADHLTGSENVSSLYFNFNDALNVQNLTFQLVSASGFTVPTVTLNQNGLKADGDGRYDIRLDFATGGTANQTFGAGDTLTFRLGFTSALTPSEFQFLSHSEGGSGPFYAAAHIQNTPGGSSGWISATTPITFFPVPEWSPFLSAVVLLVPGVLVLIGFRHRGGGRGFRPS